MQDPRILRSANTSAPSRSRRRLRRAALALAIAGCAGFATDRAHAANRTWGNTSGGTFSTAANWLGGVAPIATDLPIFQLNTAPYTVNFVGPATTAGLTMQNDSVTLALNSNTYTINGTLLMTTNNGNEDARLTVSGGTLSATSTSMGNVSTNSATLTVSGSGFASLGTTTIGGAGTGALTATSGGDVSAGAITLGASAGSAGTMTFASPGSTLTAGTTNIGGAGSGFVTVGSSATAATGSVIVGQAAGGSGTLQVGNGGWTSTGALWVGQSSPGTCEITGAGSFSSASGQIGGGPGSGNAATGRVTINGTGSRWIDTGSMTINRGTLTVLSGGTFAAASTTLFCGPTANGDTPISPAIVARGPATQVNCGTQLLSNGGTSTSAAAVIDISNGAVVSANVVVLAGSAESVCDATVDGQGSQLNSTVAFMQLANSAGARGTLRVRNYATALGAGGLTVASVAGSIGTIELSDRASFNCNADALIGGITSTNGGVGFLSVSDGALLSLPVSSAVKIYGNSRLVLNGGTVSAGTLNLVAGSRFDWNSGTLAIIGNNGATIASNSSLGNLVSLSDGRTLSTPNSTNVNAGGLLTLDGGALRTGFLGVATGGEVELRDNSSIVNGPTTFVAGLLHGDGRINGNLTVDTSGEVRGESGKRLSFYDPGASTHGNAGQLTLLGGTLEFSSPLFNGSAGRITGRGTLVVAGTGVDNLGTMTFSAGTSDVMARVTNRSNAKVIVTGGSTTTFFSPIITETNSELRVSTGSTAVFLGDVSGPGAITGAGIKDFEATATALRINASGTTRVGPSANVSADVVRDNALFVEGAIGIAPNGTSAATTRVGALAIDSDGQLDLTNNDAIVQSNPHNAVFTYLKTGYNFGGQDGTGGIISSAARNNPNGNTALGMLSGAEYLNNNGDPNFDGFTVAPSDVLIKYTYFGDVDFNGQVDVSDYNLIDFGFVNHLTGWSNGDADYSGSVDVSDYNLIDFAFSTQNGTLRRAIAYLDGTDRSTRGMSDDPSLQVIAQHVAQFGESYASGFLATVPEPTTTVLAPAIVSLLLARRKRRTPRTGTLSSGA